MRPEDMDAEDFLDVVYGEREAWVDLPAKVGNYWVPFHTQWPNESAITRRIDSSLRDREDLYYSVAQFANRGRKIEDVLPSQWLWADLDEVHPSRGVDFGLLPTVAIQSSPGRYQALWRLSSELAPNLLEKLNRALSYALDADRGGWDLTQVLRIPGTRNYKYAEAPTVQLLWYHDTLEYSPKVIWRKLKDHFPVEELKGVGEVVLPKKPLSRRARQLLRTPLSEVVEGERSARLWELECLLVESGLSEEEIMTLVWPCAWNKWRGVASGRVRLQRDITKAFRHVARRVADGKSDKPDEGVQPGGRLDEDDDVPGGEVDSDTPADVRLLPFVGYSSFMAMAMEEPKWLIEDLWVADSHGIIGGEPKTSKTTLAIAMALAVSSGQPFLNRYKVGKPGPVLMVQEETSPWRVQDIMRKVAAEMGLISRADVHSRPTGPGALGDVSLELDFPVDLPFKLLNNFGFDLSVEEHREMLLAEVEEVEPALIILDPLYLILGSADENKSHELRPYLKWLMQLRYKSNCAIALVHHFRKQSQGVGVSQVRAGQRLMGSGTLHGWVDSAMYLEALEEERDGWIKVRLAKEFRSMAPQKPIEIAMTMGEVGDLSMSVEFEQYNVEGLIKKMVSQQPGVTVNQLAEAMAMDRHTLLAHIRGGETEFRLESSGKGRGKMHRVYVGTDKGDEDE